MIQLRNTVRTSRSLALGATVRRNLGIALRTALVAAAAVIGLSGTDALAMPGQGNAMRVGPVTSQPIGHYEFCRQYPRECRVRTRDTRPVGMTPAVWHAIESVNARVNSAVRPVEDIALHGVTELWSFPQGAGDCEDYVLLKRNMLMQMGFAASDLLITVVRRPNGEGHAVLTVRTDRGDFVLDNLDGRVRHWQRTPYTFLKRQAAFHSGRWVDINHGATAYTAALR